MPIRRSQALASCLLAALATAECFLLAPGVLRAAAPARKATRRFMTMQREEAVAATAQSPSPDTSITRRGALALAGAAMAAMAIPEGLNPTTLVGTPAGGEDEFRGLPDSDVRALSLKASYPMDINADALEMQAPEEAALEAIAVLIDEQVELEMPALQGVPQKGGASLWDNYNAVLARGDASSIALKVATSTVLGGLGDVMSQKLEHRDAARGAAGTEGADAGWAAELQAFRGGHGDSTVAWARTAKFALMGGLLAPFGHWWYDFLATNVHDLGAVPAGVQRMLLDQLVFSPPFLAFTFAVLAVIEHKPPAELAAQLKREWAGAVVNIWKLWGPAQVINFCFVPTHLQVLFDNMVGLIWNCYLSGVAHNGTGDHAHTPQESSGVATPTPIPTPEKEPVARS